MLAKRAGFSTISAPCAASCSRKGERQGTKLVPAQRTRHSCVSIRFNHRQDVASRLQPKRIGEYAVPESLAQLTARLGQLVSEIMKETDPERYDQLGEEIWKVLGERESLMKENPQSVPQPGDPPATRIV